MTDYRRYRVQGGCYFFTVALHDRRLHLLVEHIEELRKAFREVKQSHPFTIDAMVVLPEHLHCILTLPEHDADFSMRWRQIKSGFSRQLPKVETATQSRLRKQERGIWQRRFWDHVIRDDTDFNHHIDYIYFNPVKHGWVDSVIDWPYSTFHRDVQRGIYPALWGSSYVSPISDVGE